MTCRMDQELQHAVNSLHKGANHAFRVGDWRRQLG
jgi:hypothetical protein